MPTQSPKEREADSRRQRRERVALLQAQDENDANKQLHVGHVADNEPTNRWSPLVSPVHAVHAFILAVLAYCLRCMQQCKVAGMGFVGHALVAFIKCVANALLALLTLPPTAAASPEAMQVVPLEQTENPLAVCLTTQAVTLKNPLEGGQVNTLQNYKRRWKQLPSLVIVMLICAGMVLYCHPVLMENQEQQGPMVYAFLIMSHLLRYIQTDYEKGIVRVAILPHVGWMFVGESVWTTMMPDMCAMHQSLDQILKNGTNHSNHTNHDQADDYFDSTICKQGDILPCNGKNFLAQLYSLHRYHDEFINSPAFLKWRPQNPIHILGTVGICHACELYTEDTCVQEKPWELYTEEIRQVVEETPWEPFFCAFEHKTQHVQDYRLCIFAVFYTAWLLHFANSLMEWLAGQMQQFDAKCAKEMNAHPIRMVQQLLWLCLFLYAGCLCRDEGFLAALETLLLIVRGVANVVLRKISKLEVFVISRPTPELFAVVVLACIMHGAWSKLYPLLGKICPAFLQCLPKTLKALMLVLGLPGVTSQTATDIMWDRSSRNNAENAKRLNEASSEYMKNVSAEMDDALTTLEVHMFVMVLFVFMACVVADKKENYLPKLPVLLVASLFAVVMAIVHHIHSIATHVCEFAFPGFLLHVLNYACHVAVHVPVRISMLIWLAAFAIVMVGISVFNWARGLKLQDRPILHIDGPGSTRMQQQVSNKQALGCPGPGAGPPVAPLQAGTSIAPPPARTRTPRGGNRENRELKALLGGADRTRTRSESTRKN